jgi:hypothetical protein
MENDSTALTGRGVEKKADRALHRLALRSMHGGSTRMIHDVLVVYRRQLRTVPTTKPQALHPPRLDRSTGFPWRSTVPSCVYSSEAAASSLSAMVGWVAWPWPWPLSEPRRARPQMHTRVPTSSAPDCALAAAGPARPVYKPGPPSGQHVARLQLTRILWT